MSTPVPAWKFWHPLPFWQALVIAAVMQIVFELAIVALDKVAGVRIPYWVGGGLGGFAMFIAVRALANRRLASESRASTRTS
jgi:hypothetical protein